MKVLGIDEELFVKFLRDLADIIDDKINAATTPAQIKILESYADGVSRVAEFFLENSQRFNVQSHGVQLKCQQN